ncbi:MAG: SHOCT domain-containing protein [Myxococcales bacterium]|nr:SHOCT domain-containing protein [Myxococcales bacterium]
MQQLTPAAEREVQELARRYGVSADSVRSLLAAVAAGGGTMAQFYIAEFGGGGQWMQGGMTMVGDMFNSRLQSTVSGLCTDLSGLLRAGQVFAPQPAGLASAQPHPWWPAELGNPSTSGGQNDVRYAYFPQARRLVIQRGGQARIYDTLDHQIGGVQQQQGGASGSLSFTSQRGTFTVDSLPLVHSPPEGYSPGAATATAVGREVAGEGEGERGGRAGGPPGSDPAAGAGSTPAHEAVLATIERLGHLRDKGLLSDDEFRSKKAELLARL